MRSIPLITLISLIPFISSSQEEKGQFIRKGLLRSMATISPGIMLKENVSTISVHGGLEYYVADNVSIRGDSYYFLQGKDLNDNSQWDLGQPFDFNHTIFSGVSYHFKTKNHFDPYLAFQPGAGITQTSYCVLLSPADGCTQLSINKSVNPLISFTLGFNYYFQKWFHLFGEARYIHGKHLSDARTPLSLNELRFSFGLGFNLNLLKTKE